MSERVMKILRRQAKRIFCLIDGIILEHISPTNLNNLSEQIKQLGSIRKSIVFFDNQLAPETYEMYLSRGFSPKIVPSDKDVFITLESLDIANSQQADIVCVGTKDDSLLPVVIKLRETIDIMLVSPTKTTAKRYLPYSDYFISLDEL
ncbi:MAG: NYN domain-containing protein [Candidatus Heimdallarchaeaceae archaeon]|jgi:uncharacterized protein (TIGR00288 family)